MCLGKGDISHGSGMRSSEDRVIFLIGGNGMYSCCLVTGADECVDIGNDGGNGMLIGSGVLSI